MRGDEPADGEADDGLCHRHRGESLRPPAGVPRGHLASIFPHDHRIGVRGLRGYAQATEGGFVYRRAAGLAFDVRRSAGEEKSEQDCDSGWDAHGVEEARHVAVAPA